MCACGCSLTCRTHVLTVSVRLCLRLSPHQCKRKYRYSTIAKIQSAATFETSSVPLHRSTQMAHGAPAQQPIPDKMHPHLTHNHALRQSGSDHQNITDPMYTVLIVRFGAETRPIAIDATRARASARDIIWINMQVGACCVRVQRHQLKTCTRQTTRLCTH